MNTNIVSIISVCIAFFSFIFSTIWNANAAKRAREKEYQDLVHVIKQESLEQSETKILFREMNKNLERIVEDNKVMNERIYNLSERLALIEQTQKNINELTRIIPVLETKTEKAHQRLDILEHELEK